MDASLTTRPGEVRLKINLYKRLKSALHIYLDNPTSKSRLPRCFRYKNIIHEAIDVWEFSQKNPQKTRKELAQCLQISQNKVYIMKTFIQRLPPEFIQNFKDCEDKKLLRILGREKLFEIAMKNFITKRRELIKELQQNLSKQVSDVVEKTAL